MVIILKKKIEATFSVREKIEEALNRAYELRGDRRRSLYYFFSKYYSSLETETEIEIIPTFAIREVLKELVPDASLDDLKAEQVQDISNALGILMAECWAGGETAKKLLIALASKKLRAEKEMRTRRNPSPPLQKSN